MATWAHPPGLGSSLPIPGRNLLTPTLAGPGLLLTSFALSTSTISLYVHLSNPTSLSTPPIIIIMHKNAKMHFYRCIFEGIGRGSGDMSEKWRRKSLTHKHTCSSFKCKACVLWHMHICAHIYAVTCMCVHVVWTCYVVNVCTNVHRHICMCVHICVGIVHAIACVYIHKHVWVHLYICAQMCVICACACHV